MTHPWLRLESGFSLNEALAIIEDDDDCGNNVKDIVIFPPENACGDVTDEDSGDEDNVVISNLPGSQLQAPAEIVFENEDDEFSSDDELPLSELLNLPSRKQQAQLDRHTAKKRKKYHWVKDTIATTQSTFPFTEEIEILESPLTLFLKFFDDEVIEKIVIESNRYAQQKNRKHNITSSEIKCFIGVLLLSGYLSVPRRRLFWEREKDCHNELVSNAITRDRFEFILSNFHIANNESLDKGDKFAKVRWLFSYLNQKFIKYAPVEENHSVDEAMVPYYGRHGCKQYIHGKPIRYGYKFWVGTTRLGYINWFEPYQGAATKINKKYEDYGVGAGVVLEYADILNNKWPGTPFQLFFDNFFTSISLMEELSYRGLHATGTVRENRLVGCNLVETKVMKKQKRGIHDYAKIKDNNIIAVKWHDNSVVCVSSNYAGIHPLHSVKRYSQKDKKNIQVEQPHLIHLYNMNMGGVDRSDQNISLYRTSLRGKKWYFPIVSHSVDMAVQNAWQLHRKRGGQFDQLSFRRRIATALLTQNKKSYSYQKGHCSTKNPIGQDIRYDRMDHFISKQDKQTRCVLCHKRATTKCLKCDKALHIECFAQYHTI